MRRTRQTLCRELLIEPELGEWLSAVWMGRRPVSSVAEPKSGWRAAALLAQGALLGRFSLERIEHASGLRITESLEPLFDNWTAAGLLRRTGALGTWIRLTDAGLYWHQALAALMRSELMPQNCLSCRTDCWAAAASKPLLKSFLPMCGRAQNGLRRSLDSLFLQSRTRIV